jgi:hypothetical protein
VISLLFSSVATFPYPTESVFFLNFDFL